MPQKRKRNNSDKGSRHLPFIVKESIEKLFERKFTYRTGAMMCDKMKTQTHLFKMWQINKFLTMKSELNDQKSSLNDKDMIDWHHHTRRVNVAGKIAPEIRHQLRPEICTQAWCKFYEIASTYLNIDPAAPYFSVHLCEAPGAFVTSLNQHLLTIGHKGPWTWLASTLNPYYEGNQLGQMIDDDRFIRHSHTNWYFGEDGTGDIMSECNLRGLRQAVKDHHVDLVTADGSIDCQWDPAEQETVVSRLQYCEALSALYILSPGGTFVLKMFTMFECRAISLMYLLNTLFDKVHVFKPCTSKGGNSEVYVVCLGYKGLNDHLVYLDSLVPHFFGDTEPAGCLFQESDIPETFLEEHHQCANFFKDCQMSAIERNLDLYQELDEGERSQMSEQERSQLEESKPDLHWEVSEGERSRSSEGERSRLEEEKDYCLECFFNRYDITPMTGRARIMKASKEWKMRGKEARKLACDRKAEVIQKFKEDGKFRGNFHDRQALGDMTWSQKVAAFETYEELVDNEDNTLWIQSMAGPINMREIEGLEPVTGRPVQKVVSSRFSPAGLLTDARELVTNVKWLSDKHAMEAQLVHDITRRLNVVLSDALSYYTMTEATATECSLQKCEQQSTSKTHTDLTGNSSSIDKSTELTEDSCKCTSSMEINGSEQSKSVRTATEIIETAYRDGSERDTGDRESTRENVMCEEDRGAEHTADDMDTTSSTEAGIGQGVSEVWPKTCQVEDGVTDVELQGRTAQFTCVDKTDGSDIFRQMMSIQACQSDNIPDVGLYTVSNEIGDKLELNEQYTMFTTVLNILKDCPPGGTVVVEMGTCLTRIMAALLYILYRSFTEIGFVHHHGALLRRHLVCVSYRHCPISLQHYLGEVSKLMHTSQSEAVLEILPVYTLLEDPEFSMFLQMSNTNLLQSFITTVVKKEQAAHKDAKLNHA